MPWLRHFSFNVCKSLMTSPAGTPARRLLEPMRMMTYDGLKGRTSRSKRSTPMALVSPLWARLIVGNMRYEA